MEQGVTTRDSTNPGYDEIPQGNDAVVIGAGLGGLACALELARQGMKVCVLERDAGAGGYAHAFRRRGYHFDVSLRFIGGMAQGQLLHGVLDTLGVYDKLTLTRRSVLFTAEYPDLTVTLPNEEEALIEALEQSFPGSRSSLVELFAYLRRMKRHAIGPWVDPHFDVPLEEQLHVLHRSDTFLQVMERYVSDPQLQALLGQLWLYVGLPPSLASATYSASVFSSAFLDGIVHVVGGGAALVRAMVHRLRDLGGACITRTAVNRILLDGRAVIGVETERGEVVEAPTVVSNADPYQTFFELIPGNEPSKLYRFRLEQMEPSCSLYSMYLGLDCPADALGIPKGHYFFNHALDHEDAWERAISGETERTDWCLANYDETEASLFPPGTGIITLAEVAPTADWLELDLESYRERKEQLQQLLLAKYERRFPGLVDHITVAEMATPRTMANYTRNRSGAVYGLAQTVEQSGSRRLRNRTPLSGLYLTGSWTWAGGGYEGALLSGVQTAASVLRVVEAPKPAPPIRLSEPTGDGVRPPAPPTHAMPTMEAAEGSEHLRHSLNVVVFGDEMNSRGFADASAYVRYMDRGRVEAIEQICHDAGTASWLEEYVVNVYRIDAHTVTTAKLGHRLDVRTGLRKTSSHRAAFDQLIVDLTTGDVVVDSVVEVLFLNQDRRLVPVPDSFPDTFDDKGPPSHERREPVEFSDDSHFPFRARFRVYFEDTDAQGITYHVSYLRFCERALFELTRAAWPEMSMNTWMARNRMNVARLDIRYLKATTLGDWLEVRTGARQLSTDRLAFDQRIVLADTGQVVADAITDVECRDEHEQPAPIPALIVDAYFETLPPER